MSNQLHSELKKEFQLERMILFSDAVFAIAITLLVIEIKVPEIDKHIVNDLLLRGKLDEMMPKFVGFMISFFIIGNYWIIHHRTFGYVIDYTPRLLWLNLVFMLGIVLMPFSTAIYSTYVLRLMKTPMIIYILNIVFLSVMNQVLWYYVRKPANKLSEGITSRAVKEYNVRAITFPAIFILVAIAYLVAGPRNAMWAVLFIPIISRLIKKYYLPAEKTK
jgi:uncharacterized membrane protein